MFISSFYPRTIRDWNNLTINIIESRDFTYLLIYLLTIFYVINCMCDFTIRGFTPGKTSRADCPVSQS